MSTSKITLILNLYIVSVTLFFGKQINYSNFVEIIKSQF